VFLEELEYKTNEVFITDTEKEGIDLAKIKRVNIT